MPDVPDAGPDLDFDSWNRRLVACLRQKLPNVVAVRRGKVATLGYGDRSVTIEDRHPTWFVNFSANMAGLALDRFDDFTARTAASSPPGLTLKHPEQRRRCGRPEPQVALAS